MRTGVLVLVMCVCVVVIFSAGFWVGKASSPESLSIEEVRDYARREAGKGVRPGRLRKLEALQRYTRILGLSEEQRREVYPLFEAASRKIQPLPPRSRERLEVVEQFHEDLQPYLTERQKEMAEEILEEARERKRR